MHISVCICTYKRIEFLKNLITRLVNLETNNLFSYSVAIIDNDLDGSAKFVVDEIKSMSNLDIQYFVEPKRNIAIARNSAVTHTSGELIVFIDDDEYPANNQWLISLYQVYSKCNNGGVIGPVSPHYLIQPQEWIKKGDFFENRLDLKTGILLKWNECATSNTLLSRKIFQNGVVFDINFGRSGGEDSKFFKDSIERGFNFTAAHDALVYEIIPPQRCTLLWLFKRAFRTGGIYAYIAKADKYFMHKILFSFAVLLKIFLLMLILPFSILKGLHATMRVILKIVSNVGKFFGVANKLFIGY